MVIIRIRSYTTGFKTDNLFINYYIYWLRYLTGKMTCFFFKEFVLKVAGVLNGYVSLLWAFTPFHSLPQLECDILLYNSLNIYHGNKA